MFYRGGQNLKRWLFLVPLILCPAIFVGAQDDPFGVKDDDGPAATPASPKAPEDGEDDPIVLAVRDSNPSDPTSWFRALKLMVDIERPPTGSAKRRQTEESIIVICRRLKV